MLRRKAVRSSCSSTPLPASRCSRSSKPPSLPFPSSEGSRRPSRCPDRFLFARALDLFDHRLLPRLDRNQSRLGYRQRGDAGQRGRGSVIGHLHRIEDGQVGAPGANLAELSAQILQRFFDSGLQLVRHVLIHLAHRQLLSQAQVVSEAPTRVPISSLPNIARRMLPLLVRSNTTIGSLLSMQREIAVESITFKVSRSTSM